MQVMITGHAGCEGGQANSLDGISKALHSAADCVEVDCRLQDGILVLNHDEVEDGKGYVTLEEAFDRITTANKKINCDLKEEAVFGPCLDLIRSRKVEDRVFFSGSVPLADLPQNGLFRVFVNAELLLEVVDVPAVKNAAEQIKSLYLAGQKAEAEHLLIASAADHLDLVAEAFAPYSRYETVAGLNLDYRWLRGLDPAATALKDVPLSLWTVDEPSQLKAFLAGPGKVVNITTNRPNLAGEFLSGTKTSR